MVNKDYVRDLTEASDSLVEMLAEKEKLEVAIARQKKRIAALVELCDTDEDAEPTIDLDLGGLTDACRTVLRGSRKTWLTISEIQQGLQELGFPLKDYKAATASITTTVNRLVDAHEVVIEKHVGGANEYKWVGPSWGAPRSLANMLDDKRKDDAKRIAVVAEAAAKIHKK